MEANGRWNMFAAEPDEQRPSAAPGAAARAIRVSPRAISASPGQSTVANVGRQGKRGHLAEKVPPALRHGT
jgi:hypothetical protein